MTIQANMHCVQKSYAQSRGIDIKQAAPRVLSETKRKVSICAIQKKFAHDRLPNYLRVYLCFMCVIITVL